MIVWWWFALIFKLALVSVLPHTADENYYWVWSQNLQLSYFDHPPFVAWLFRLGEVFPSFMVKWPAVILGHFALVIWAKFLRNIGFAQPQIKTWFLIVVMAPLIGLSVLVLTPDLPLLFFYSVAIYSFERALTVQRFQDYALFGIAIGLGFTSKYHIVLVLPCLFFYIIFSKQWNRIRWVYVGGMLLLMVVGAGPVLLWNFQHDWASFRFQIHHGVGKKAWKTIWPVEYFASVLFLILPQYWGSLWLALRDNRQRLLMWLCLPILGFFMATSLRSKVEANWVQIAFLPLLSLLAVYDRTRWKSWTTAFTWFFLVVAVIFFWNRPRFPGCPEKLCEPRRYETLKGLVDKYQPFFASNYQMASYLWYQMRVPVYKLNDMSRTDFFDSFPQSKPETDLFYVAKHLDTGMPEWLLQKGYKTELVRQIDDDLVILKVYR